MATLLKDERTVLLTVSGVELGDRHELTVHDVKDRADPANTLAAATVTFTVRIESIKLEGTVIGKGSPYNGNADVTFESAVDGSTSTFADCTGDPVWVGYDLGDGTQAIITGFRYYPRNGYSDRMIGKSFEVSTDGAVWEKVYTIPSAPPEETFTASSVPDTRPVRYVRYNGSGGYLNTAEVEFWGYPAGPSHSIARRAARVKGLSLLRGPLTVVSHSLDGKSIRTWTAHDAENLLSTAEFKSVDRNHGPAGLRIVSVVDSHGTKLHYTFLCR